MPKPSERELYQWAVDTVVEQTLMISEANNPMLEMVRRQAAAVAVNEHENESEE